VVAALRVEERASGGLPLSNTALFLLRSFLVTMTSATLSKLPAAIGLWELIQGQPGLRNVLGPAQAWAMALLHNPVSALYKGISVLGGA